MKLIFQAYKKTDQILLCQLSITVKKKKKKKKKSKKAHKRYQKLFEEKIKQEKKSNVASYITIRLKEKVINVNVSINILQKFF